MKKNKLLLCIMSCLLITSCSNNNSANPEDIFSGKENIELFTNNKYTLFLQKYYSNNLVYYYEELFGKINQTQAIVQYNYTYTYKFNNKMDNDLINDVYQNILSNLEIIKDEYKNNNLVIKENGYEETCLFNIDNPNKKELSVVIVDLYIPFILKDLNTHKTSYFTLPMYKYELLKHDDLIKGFDGKEIEFNEFITTYDILKK